MKKSTFIIILVLLFFSVCLTLGIVNSCFRGDASQYPTRQDIQEFRELGENPHD